MRIFIFLVVAAAVFAAAHCGGTASIVWTAITGAQNSGDDLGASPVFSNADNSILYTFGQTSTVLTVMALGASNGAILWTWASTLSSSDIWSVSGMSIGSFGLYFASSAPQACGGSNASSTNVCVFAIGFDGTPRWKSVVPTNVASPSVTKVLEVDDVAVVGAGSTLYALSKDTGNILATYSSGLDGLFSSFDSPISCNADGLYFVSQCSVYAVTRDFNAKAQVLWNVDIPLFSGGCSCQHFELGAQLGYVLNANNHVSQISAFDLLTGAIVFAINSTFDGAVGQVTFVPELSAIAFAGSGYAPTATLADASTGAVRWTTPTDSKSTLVSYGVITNNNGWLYTSQTDGQTIAALLALDSNGTTVFDLPLPNVKSGASISRAYMAGVLAVYAYGGSLYAVNSNQANTPAPTVPTPIVMVTYPASLACQGAAVSESYPELCEFGSSSSVLRFCKKSPSGPVLTVQYFNASVSCSGTPQRVSEYVLGRCYVDDSQGTSFQVTAC